MLHSSVELRAVQDAGPVSPALLQRLEAVETELATLGQALHQQDSRAVDHAAAALHQALAQAAVCRANCASGWRWPVARWRHSVKRWPAPPLRWTERWMCCCRAAAQARCTQRPVELTGQVMQVVLCWPSR
jgi:hypothetical protein